MPTRLKMHANSWSRGIISTRTVLDKVVASNPKSKNSAQYMYILGACELEDGNYDNAERLLTEAKKKGRLPPICISGVSRF